MSSAALTPFWQARSCGLHRTSSTLPGVGGAVKQAGAHSARQAGACHSLQQRHSGGQRQRQQQPASPPRAQLPPHRAHLNSPLPAALASSLASGCCTPVSSTRRSLIFWQPCREGRRRRRAGWAGPAALKRMAAAAAAHHRRPPPACLGAEPLEGGRLQLRLGDQLAAVSVPALDVRAPGLAGLAEDQRAGAVARAVVEASAANAVLGRGPEGGPRLVRALGRLHSAAGPRAVGKLRVAALQGSCAALWMLPEPANDS